MWICTHWKQLSLIAWLLWIVVCCWSTDHGWIKRFTCLQKMKYHSQKLAHTVSLSTAMRLAFWYLLQIVGLEYLIVLNYWLDDLIQRLSQILGSMLGYSGCHYLILAGLVYNRIGSGITDKLIWVVELINSADFRAYGDAWEIADTRNGFDRRIQLGTVFSYFFFFLFLILVNEIDLIY